MDAYDALCNQKLYREWDEFICLNGWDCDSPWCPDHTPINPWHEADWPVLMSASDEMRSIEEGSADQCLR